MKKFIVTVIQEVEVTLDESKFTEEFMNDFSKDYHHIEDIEGHARHIAEVIAQDSGYPNYIDGYGDLEEMGIGVSASNPETEVEVQS